MIRPNVFSRIGGGFFILLILLTAPASASDAEWTGGTGNWSNAGNWSPPVALDGAGVVVEFPQTPSHVSLDMDVTVGSVMVTSEVLGPGVTIAGPGTLSLYDPGGVVSALTQALTIDADVTLETDTTFESEGGFLTINGTIDGPGGLRAMAEIPLQWATLTPELRAEWLREYRSDARSLSARFAGAGSTFTVRGQDPASDVAVLNAGLAADFLNGLSGEIAYELYTECGPGLTSHSVSVHYEF